jgi:hypothetical protein
MSNEEQLPAKHRYAILSLLRTSPMWNELCKGLLMPEINGYKTIDVIASEMRVGERKIREAIDALHIEPTTFKLDRRVKYYSPDDFTRIRDWLLSH